MPSAVLTSGALLLLSIVAVAHAPSPSARTTAAATCLRLADDIGHLPIRVDGPGLDRVVVLHEADDGAHLGEVRYRGLDVAGAVDRAAHEHGGLPVPVPRDLEAREALVHDRLLEHGLAPVLAAIEGDVDAADLAGARPGEAAHLVETGFAELHAARGRGDDRLALHHHAELAPLPVRHRVGIA